MKKFWYTVSAASSDPTTTNDVFRFWSLSASKSAYRWSQASWPFSAIKYSS